MKTIQDILIEKIKEAQKKNKYYSLRALAKSLDVSPATISGLINHNRTVSDNLARKILKKFLLDKKDKTQIVKNHQKSKSLNFSKENIEEERFKIISDWYHFAIISYLNIKDASHDISEMAKRFSVSEEKIQEAINRLLALEMINVDENDRYVNTNKRFFAGGEIPSIYIRKHHVQILEKAKASLDEFPIDKRLVTNITFAIDEKKIAKACRLIYEFQEKMNKFFATGRKSNVYNLGINLFPLIKDK